MSKVKVKKLKIVFNNDASWSIPLGTEKRKKVIKDASFLKIFSLLLKGSETASSLPYYSLRRRKKNTHKNHLRPRLIFLRINAIFVIFLLTGVAHLGLFSINETVARMSDLEETENHVIESGTLQLVLTASTTGWNPTGKELDLLPGDTVEKIVDLLNEGSLPLIYTVSSTETGGDNAFCNALLLESTLQNSSTSDSGTVLNLNLGPVLFESPETWIFNVTLPTSSTGFSGKECAINFIYKASQENATSGEWGYTDSRIVSNLFRAGTVSSTEPDDNTLKISPIKDLYIDEDHEDKNFGESTKLLVKSKKNANARTLIRFHLPFPTSTTILSANLKLYMAKAPNESRLYEARRVEEVWHENDITWENQPDVSGGATDIIETGTTNKVRLAWDVTNDVENFVSGIYGNFGWQIRDNAEDNNSTKQAEFRSRETKAVSQKPFIEIAFITPPVSTNHLVINEVYPRVANGKGTDSKNEWVEIYNPTNDPVDITGWKICDSSSCDTIPASPAIPGKGFAVITTHSSTWDFWPDLPAEAIKIVLGGTIGNGFRDEGDSAILRNASNVKIDSMNYRDQTSEFDPPVFHPKKGISLARIVKGYDTDTFWEWILNATPNPGTNPGSNGVEIIRFAEDGLAIAPLAIGLEPVVDTEELESDPIMTTLEEDNLSTEEKDLSEDAVEEVEESLTTPEVVNPEQVSPEETPPVTNEAPSVEESPTSTEGMESDNGIPEETTTTPTTDSKEETSPDIKTEIILEPESTTTLESATTTEPPPSESVELSEGEPGTPETENSETPEPEIVPIDVETQTSSEIQIVEEQSVRNDSDDPEETGAESNNVIE